MPSWQSSLLNMTLRRVVKNRIKGFKTFFEVRNLTETLAAKLTLPKNVSVRPVDINGVQGEWISHALANRNKVILYLHGGAYCLGSPRTHRDLTWRLSQAAEARVLVPDYRLAPEHKYPAAVDDAVTAWIWLLEQGYKPENMAISGDSAGGGLAMATIVKLRDLGYALPAAMALMSPWTDLSQTSESRVRNKDADPMLPADQEYRVVDAYVGDHDPYDPLISTVYADLTGLPPLMIQVGSTEIVLDDSTRVAAKARESGVEVCLEIWEKMPHVFQMFAFNLPEAQQAIDKLGSFLMRHLAMRRLYSQAAE